MSDHKISANGLSIECHAAPDAKCRQRVACDSEAWSYTEGCEAHDPPHQTGPGECWQIQWVNASGDLEDSYDKPGEYPGAVPGAAVRLISEMPDYMNWEYDE